MSTNKDEHIKTSIRGRLRSLPRWQYFPFVLLAVFMLVFYLLATGKYGDDLFFQATNPLQNGLLETISTYYQTWSSRLIIMPVCILLCVLPIMVWRILDLAVLMLSVVCVSKLCVRNPRSNWVLAASMLLYPYWHMGTAGWISTTCNFLWPLSLGLFVLLTLKRLFEGKKLPWYRYVLAGLAFIYATDAEQACVLFVAIPAFLLLHRRLKRPDINRRYTAAVILLLILSILRLIFTLTAPGNAIRLEGSLYMIPGFEGFSIWDKLALGFDLTVTHYAVCTLGLFLFFSVLLMLTVWHRSRRAAHRAAACIPLASCVALTVIAGIRALSNFSALLAAGQSRGFANAIFEQGLLPAWPGMRLLFILFFCSVLYSLYVAFEGKKEAWAAIGITLLGFGSQLMMGFSVTMYASALRTFIYAAFGLIICTLMLYEKYTAQKSLGRGMKIPLTAICALSYALTFAIGLFKMGGP